MACLATIAMGASAGSAVGAGYPYRNWTRSPGNTAGVVFHPDGDRWDIYDNRRDGYPVFVRFGYLGKSGIEGRWHEVGHVIDGHVSVTRNVAEHRMIVFQVFSN